MPKITKKTVRIREEEFDKAFELQINFNETFSFHADIPAEFDEQLAQLSSDETREKHIVGGRYAGKRQKISGSSIPLLIEHFEDLVKGFLKEKITKRAVIIIDFVRHGENNVYNHRNRSQDLPETGLTLAAQFCDEVKAGDSKPKYFAWKEDFFDRGKMNYNEVYGSRYNSDDKRLLVIDNTPENRAFITELHTALKSLSDRIHEMSKSQENFLQLVSSNQKLIS